MITRIREFLRSESLGITIPVGVVVLWATWGLIQSVVGNFVYPVFLEAFGDGQQFERFPLDFTIGGVQFQWDSTLISIISMAILLNLVYFVFVRPLRDAEDELDHMRDCPECKSSIFSEATRCAFCTATVTPIFEAESDG